MGNEGSNSHHYSHGYPVRMGRPTMGVTPAKVWKAWCVCGESFEGSAPRLFNTAKVRALKKLATHIKKMSENNDSSVAGN